MIQNDLLLRTLKGEKVERPPVWVMRQAGRILPNYRKIRAKAGSFKKLVTQPDWIAEATVEPVDILGVDAAIIFSDILVVPEAMGLNYEIIEKKGPQFDKKIKSQSDIDILKEGDAIPERLEYVFDSIKKTKEVLNGTVPLIGFAGAPWTIFAYMIEGSGSKTFSEAKKMIYQEPKLAHNLMSKITSSTIHYLKQKVNSGIDVIQLFDSWSGLLDAKIYREFAWPYAEAILREFPDVPTIFFPKGAWFSYDDFSNSQAFDCLGLGWSTDATYARTKMGKNRLLQGNLDPCQLYASEEEIVIATEKMINSFGRNYIANLGHGVYPDTSVDKVKSFIRTVKNYTYK
ncbi:MAG: uroporphyrinogen decarboxylase [Saprospiraceae bacterium]